MAYLPPGITFPYFSPYIPPPPPPPFPVYPPASAYSRFYKQPAHLPYHEDQNARRARLLAEQKRVRNQLQDQSRQIYNGQNGEVVRGGGKPEQCRAASREYKNRIMYSEWLIETEPEFDANWLMKMCPEGHRNLIVAVNHTTKSYSKSGIFECEFQSDLPGGNKKSLCHFYKTTILDCFWVAKQNKFYILDVLMWADFDLQSYSAEFRFFWLQSKLEELPEIDKKTPLNQYQFHYIPHLACDATTLKESFATYPYYASNQPQVDGILFYHKDGSYTAGQTPIVGWLKPYMIPEVFKIKIAMEYYDALPTNYKNYLDFIKLSEAKKAHKKKKTHASAMDVAEASTSRVRKHNVRIIETNDNPVEMELPKYVIPPFVRVQPVAMQETTPGGMQPATRPIDVLTFGGAPPYKKKKQQQAIPRDINVIPFLDDSKMDIA